MWADDLIRESKKLIRRGKKIVKGLPPEQQELLGLVAGKLIGDEANRLYEPRTAEQKALWEASRPMHHGDLGFVLAKDGKKKRDPLMKGVGQGLMLSDIKDRDKWIHSRKKSAKKRRSKRP